MNDWSKTNEPSVGSASPKKHIMAEWQRFANAPIAEALLDVRAKLRPGIELPQLAAFQDSLKERYPTRRERFSWEGGFVVKGGTPEVLHPSGGPDGFIFTSSDGRQLVQARLDGFTFNKLRPYDRWGPFRDEAREHWDRYRKIAEPEIISRVALRYINRIEIPLPLKDFREYILTTPEIAPGLPQGLSGFFMRLLISDERSGCSAIVTETMEPLQKDVLPLILDIDVFREAAFDANGTEMWDTLERLRDFKNEIFFKSITDKAKELFK
jgi:uncharacterized protein (TIGR04255 family)